MNNEKPTTNHQAITADLPPRRRKRITDNTQVIPCEIIQEVRDKHNLSKEKGYVSYNLSDRENNFIRDYAENNNLSFQQAYEITMRSALDVFIKVSNHLKVR